MNTTIKKSLQGLLFVPVLALGASAVVPIMQSDVVSATDFDNGIQGGLDATGQNDTGKDDVNVTSLVTKIINILLFVVGAVSIIMIIFGGFKYVTSGGDSSGVTAAKNTILYAIIGLVVASLAYVLVNFVLNDLLTGITS